MAEYIEREAAIEAIWQILNGMGISQKHNDRLVEEVDAVIDDIPAADVREVVLCRECIHLNREKENMSGFYRCDRYDAWQDENDRVHMPLDGFCSYGDRGAEMRGEADGT